MGSVPIYISALSTSIHDSTVLNDSCYQFPSIGIVGTSGAGKTTTVDILLGLLKPQAGQILADGVDVCSMMIMLGIMIAIGTEMESLIPSLSAFVMAAVKLLPSANRMLGAATQMTFFEPALDDRYLMGAS